MIYIQFHIGRGGRYHNAGHLSFVKEGDFQDLLTRCGDSICINTVDENDRPLPDDEWSITDNGGNVLLKGRDSIESNLGYLEFDTIYNTDYVTTTDELSDKELQCLWRAYRMGDSMSEELKDNICSLIDLKRAHKVSAFPTNILVFTQFGVDNINTDGLSGELTEDDWIDTLENMKFCPFTIEKIIDELKAYYVIQD